MDKYIRFTQEQADDIVINGALVPHTCEHCKFYNLFSPSFDGYCKNETVKDMVYASYQEDDTQFDKNFGCIFWGKE